MFTRTALFQEKLDMALSVKPLHTGCLLSLYAEIISMKSRFWEICLRYDCLLYFIIIIFLLLCWSSYHILVEILYYIFEQYYQAGVEMIRRDLLTGHWKPYLERAISLKPCYEGGINGGEVISSLLEFCYSILGKEITVKD